MGWVFHAWVFGVIATHMVNGAIETMALISVRLEFVQEKDLPGNQKVLVPVLTQSLN